MTERHRGDDPNTELHFNTVEDTDSDQPRCQSVWGKAETSGPTPSDSSHLSQLHPVLPPHRHMPNKPETLVQHPEKKLEDVRNSLTGNECDGRGRSTAAGRGYNTERLAGAVLNTDGDFFAYADSNWYDTVGCDDPVYSCTECKSCVYRYPSGGYGRFRIWQQNHYRLLGNSCTSDEKIYLYFFVVYEIEDGVEREVGKVVAPVELVDSVLDNWNEVTHQTMGTQYVRDISWHLLLKRLGVSEHELRAELTVDFTQRTEPDTDGTT